MSYFTEMKVVDPITGEAVNVNERGQMHVVLRGAIDENNSTTTLLVAGEEFIGDEVDILDYAIIFVSVYSDVASAVDGLELQQSCDGLNWDIKDVFTIEAATGKIFSVQPGCRYFRVKYTNGGTNQSEFRLHTLLKKTNSKPSSHRLKDNITDDDDAELRIAIIKGQNPAGDYVDFDATTQGNFKISLEELENNLSVNGNSQLKVTRFDSSGDEAPLASSTDPNHNKLVGTDYVSGNSGIDSSTEALQTISYEHHEVHEGKHFGLCDYALNQAASAVVEFIITTPNTTEWAHFTFKVSSSEGATIELYEGATGITGGAAQTPVNNNRNSATSSSLTILKDPSAITGDGTRLFGHTAGGSRTAGANRREHELVLKQNETYLIRITSLAVANDIDWCFEWYEHTNKN